MAVGANPMAYMRTPFRDYYRVARGTKIPFLILNSLNTETVSSTRVCKSLIALSASCCGDLPRAWAYWFAVHRGAQRP